ncbi:hypothetical protein D777_00235 [Marinobacter nitratireducens]|uniref:Uncharacterized protein n=1 Tax=Marinobacter nitratireducens TaxID=1137280 RepID=A0A072N9L8_9GAMM|nr:hypothetical protein D777_00235 [Marinobacter nitratireducens]
MCLAGPESPGRHHRLPEKLGRYSIPQMGEKSSSKPPHEPQEKPPYGISRFLLNCYSLLVSLPYGANPRVPFFTSEYNRGRRQLWLSMYTV